MRTPSALAALGAAAVLTLAACGDDGGGAAGPYVDALLADFEQDGDIPFEEADARCLAESFVDTIGVDELEDNDITPEELAATDDPGALGLEFGEEEADSFADGIAGCDLSVGEVLLVGARSAGAEVPDDLVACVDENIDEDAFYGFVADSIVDEAAVDQAAVTALFADGDVDVVVAAWGVLGDQAEAEADAAAAVAVARTNYLGAVSALTIGANLLREQGHGALVVLSSVAGERVRRSNYVYGSTKAGLDGFCQGLAAALVGSGVHLLVVRPGFVATKMTAGMDKVPMSTTPDSVAEATVAALTAGRTVVWVPAPLRIVMAVLRHVPTPVFRRLPL